MRPVHELDATGVNALLFDIDDTLTTHGRLTAPAYSALERLQAAGIAPVAVTGRPAGWCDHIARMWPVAAVIGENGAFYFHMAGGRLRRRFWADAPTREAARARLAEVAELVQREVPGCALASDQPYRETDLAIDYCEDVPALPLEAAERIAALMRAHGLTAKVSSIHVNGWIGDYDKLRMARIFFWEHLHADLDTARERVVYVGDSPNDAPMFRYFPRSVGVANVARFTGRIEALPRFVTQAESGAGFAELAAYLLARRA